LTPQPVLLLIFDTATCIAPDFSHRNSLHRPCVVTLPAEVEMSGKATVALSDDGAVVFLDE
jgi:hypothetical protein